MKIIEHFNLKTISTFSENVSYLKSYEKTIIEKMEQLFVKLAEDTNFSCSSLNDTASSQICEQTKFCVQYINTGKQQYHSYISITLVLFCIYV